jgi:F-type H+-transporting ATPase subunit c
MKKVFNLGVMAALFTLTTVPALAQEAAGHGGGIEGKHLVGMAAALALGIAAFGGAIGQSRAAVAALEGIARNPAASGKIFVPMIIGLALIESLVIYALVIAFQAIN